MAATPFVLAKDWPINQPPLAVSMRSKLDLRRGRIDSTFASRALVFAFDENDSTGNLGPKLTVLASEFRHKKKGANGRPGNNQKRSSSDDAAAAAAGLLLPLLSHIEQ